MTSIEPDVSWTAQKVLLHKMVLDVREKLSKYNESVMCCLDPGEDKLRHSLSAAPKNVGKNIKNNALGKKMLLKEKSTSIKLKQSYQKDREITKKKKLESRQRKKSPLKIRTIRSDTKNRKVDQRTATKWIVSVSNSVTQVDRLRSNTNKSLLVRKCRATSMLEQKSPRQQKNIKQAKLLQKTEPKIVRNKKSSIPSNSNALSRTTMKSALNGNYQSSFPLYYSSWLVKRSNAGTLLLDKSGKTPYQNSVSYYNKFLKVPPSTRTRLFEEQNKNVLNKRVAPENNLPRRYISYEGCWLRQSVGNTNSRDNGKQLLRSLRLTQMPSLENIEDGYVTSRFRSTKTTTDAICENNCTISEFHTTSSSSSTSTSRSNTKPMLKNPQYEDEYRPNHTASSSSSASTSRSSTKPMLKDPEYEDEYGQKSQEAAKPIDFDDNNVKENQNVEPCRSRISTIKESTREDDHKRRKKVRNVENSSILRNAIRRSTPRKMKRKNIFLLKACLNNDLEQNPRKTGDGCHLVESQRRIDIVIENTTGDIKETETADSAEYSKVCAKQNSESTRVVSTNTSNSIMSLKPIYALLWSLKLFFGFRNS